MSETGEQEFTPENPDTGPGDNVVTSPFSQQQQQAEAEGGAPEAEAAKADDDESKPKSKRGS
jgi:hypothetical protein